MASEEELDEMRALLNRARREIDDLTNMIRSHVGLDWGATGTNLPHPSVPFPYQEVHGPRRETVDATHSMTFVVDFDEVVLALYQAKLKLQVKAVRSNVSAAAADGEHSHVVLGYTAATIAGATRTTVTGTTVANHTHGFGDTIDGGLMKLMHMRDVDGNTVQVSFASLASHEDLYTYAAEADHTHGLNYGIYEGPAPTSPGITITINGVDRTTALGGPWQTDATIDITEYLREEIGVPLRQANTIVLTANKLIDLEVVCKSLVSAASPLSIGTRTL